MNPHLDYATLSAVVDEFLHRAIFTGFDNAEDFVECVSEAWVVSFQQMLFIAVFHSLNLSPAERAICDWY